MRLLNYIFCIFLTGTIAFSGGFQVNEHGARGMAMGGAFSAQFSPISIFYNPAGIAFLKGTNFTIGTTLIFPSAKFRGPYQFNTTAETQMEKQVFYPSNIYITHKLGSKLGVGIGVFNPYGLGTKWPDDWVGKDITVKSELMTFYINPTIAYKLADVVSIGAGFNFVYGAVTLTRKVSSFSPEVDVELKGSGTGFGFNAGVLVKPLKFISIGFSYRSSVKVDFKGDANFKKPPVLDPLLPGGKIAASFTFPSIAFAGVAINPTDNFTVEFDYQFTGWSVYDKLKVDFEKETAAQKDLEEPKNFKNSYILRGGAEYRFGNFAVRAGVLWDKNPVEDKYLDPSLPDADRLGISAGFGYKMGSLKVDVAYMFLRFKQREVRGTVIGFDGVYNSSAHLLGVNISYEIF